MAANVSCSRSVSQSSLSRKEKLKRWKEETGRTPMKRLSYVCEYWKEGKTVVPGHSTPRFKKGAPKVRNNTNAGQTTKNERKQSKMKTSIENRDPSVQVKGKREPASNPKTHNKDNRQLFRRSMLKKPRSPVHKNQQTPSCTTIVSSPRSVTLETNDTTAVSTSPGACHQHVDGSIEQDHTPCLNNVSDNSKQQNIKRRSHVRFLDQSAVFCSTAICYTDLSKKRTRKRTEEKEEEKESDAVSKSLVWVTPVRRSTRRSQGGRPSVIPSANICDSPSEFSKQEGDCEVMMVPNMALEPLLVD